MSALLNIRVSPRASKNEVVPLGNDLFKVRITAAPVDGGANKKLIDLLAAHFRVAKNRVRIVRGLKNKTKLVEIV